MKTCTLREYITEQFQLIPIEKIAKNLGFRRLTSAHILDTTTKVVTDLKGNVLKVGDNQLVEEPKPKRRRYPKQEAKPEPIKQSPPPADKSDE